MYIPSSLILTIGTAVLAQITVHII
jgi:hypothetical protein